MADIYKKDEFHRVFEKELRKNILPQIIREIVEGGEAHLRMLMLSGEKYKIKVEVDEKKLTGKISAPGLRAMEIEEEKHHFKKTFEHMSNRDTLRDYFKRLKTKRITDKYLPDSK